MVKCNGEHFCFNIDLQILNRFFFPDIRNKHLGPYRSLILKKMAPKTFHYWKGLVILHIFCSICFHILFNRKKLWIKTCENFVVLKFCALASYNGLHHWCINITFCLKITFNFILFKITSICRLSILKISRWYHEQFLRS